MAASFAIIPIPMPLSHALGRSACAMSRSCLLVVGLLITVGAASLPAQAPDRPNILFAFADDWGWPHAGAYGDRVIKTPTFDRLAREGALYQRAFVSSPSCSPSRAAIVTGQWHWRLREAANLHSTIPKEFPVYPDLLEQSGYHVGYTRKGWGPGKLGERDRNPAGSKYKNFDEFLGKRPEGKPFCFWFGSNDPHRGYKLGSGEASGMDLDEIELPACFPDSREVRGDVADYYFEVQRFDREVGGLLAALEDRGELDSTIVVMSGDHGMPFPRCKGNLYDSGAHVPLVVRWPLKVSPGRRLDDFVSLTDLAPTFLEAAGLPVPKVMTGRSLMKSLTAEASGLIDPSRDHALIGKERHVPCQEAPDSGGTPMRAIRTADWLYIRNFRPDRWPAGTPNYQQAFLKNSWYGDADNGPTKSYMIAHREKDETHRKLFALAFGKRPAEELYDLRSDPDQLVNLASDPARATDKKALSSRLMAALRDSGDPRAQGGGDEFDRYPYTGGTPRYPGPKKTRKSRADKQKKVAKVGDRKPNFVLIFCDDLGYGDIGCFGSTKHRTPNIDKMAEEGMRLTSFYVSSGVCTPSRSSLMTGSYPRRVNMHTDGKGGWVLFPIGIRGLHPDEVTTAEILKGQGYATKCVGKWHLGDQANFLPTRQGFDSYFGIPYSNDMGTRQKSNRPPLPLMRNETVIEAPADQDTLTKRYTQEAVDFIKSHVDEPFFLYLPHTMPHNPVHASSRFSGKSANGGYGDCVEEIDWSTGQILAELRAQGIDEHTLVIFTSDNGAASRWGGSNLPLSGFKGSTMEGGMRVPAVVRWPGKVAAGSACSEMTLSMDLLPSFARLAGAKLPSDRKIDGRDITPLLFGEAGAKTPHEAFYYYYRDQLQAVRSGEWKLHLSRKDRGRGKNKQQRVLPARLFNLESDIGEKRDLTAAKPAVVERLLALAERARRDIGDGKQVGENQRPAGHVEDPKPLVKN